MPSAAYEKLRERAWKAWQPWEESTMPRVTVGISACSLSVGAGETLAVIRSEVQRLGLEVRIMEVGDIGFCWAEPVVGVAHPGEPFVLYGPVAPEIAARFVADILVARLPRRDVALGTMGKGTVEGISPLSDQPWMRHQRRLVMKNFGIIGPGNLDHYVAKGGYWSFDKALFEMKPAQVIDEVKASNLRGRGGAVFPTGTKWGFMTNAPAPKYLAVNGEEGDPGAFTDKGIVENDPHMLLEGALISAYAMGCTKTFIHIRAEYFLAVERLRRAVRELEEAGLVGHHILGSEFSHEIEVEATGHAYICGEETALMESVEGKRGAPRPRPPFPAQYGIFGRPTNVNNVKTISYVPAVLRMGADAFLKLGTQNASGTAMLSLSGHINKRGIAEIPVGLNLKTVIEDVAGGVRNGKKAKALQCGGPLGGLMAATEMDMIAEFQAMTAKSSPLGSGG
ncbi:MAG: NADH-quinone oxidoreductase subunit F, partial [Chloroflexi bacterium]|nr:NADH-quinone oxidoreductase subunit F [Chloroflexota bacterium]